MIGRGFGHYRIVREIGVGGMGSVFEAEDLHLGRIVALKVLSAELAADEKRRRRFGREARAIAALNHPNIITIYSVEEAEGLPFITMELIEGHCLSDLIPHAGLGYPAWLALARPLAGAVAAAHRQGITHRDLKPDNVMIDASGQLKVLDFGLAKVVDAGAGVGLSQLRTQSMTQLGSVVGTAAYMSPEQAEGKAIDERSDIFSLGSVLYEMATGTRPFEGDSHVAILSAVIRDRPPPVKVVKPALGDGVGRLISRCLEKDPKRRYPSAEVLAAEIDELPGSARGSVSIEVVGSAGRGRRRGSGSRVSQANLFLRRNPRVAWVALTLVAVVATAGVVGFSRPDAPVFEARQILPFAVEGDLSVGPSWSPDGRWIVFASNRGGAVDLWRKSLSSLATERLTDNQHTESDPAWSPDGSNIAYASDAEGGGIFVMRAAGGESIKVSDFGAHPSWSPDSRLLAFDWYGRVYTVPLDGGQPTRLFDTDGVPRPVFSPDGQKLAFWDRARNDLVIASLDGNQVVELEVLSSGEEVSGLSWSADGATIVMAKGSFGAVKDIWRIPMDPVTGDRVGEATRLAATPLHDVDCSLSPDGRRIAYSSQRLERNLWSMALDPAGGLLLPDEPPALLTTEGQNSVYPALSPDGSLVVWTAQTYGRGSLYYRRLENGEAVGGAQKLTSDETSREVTAAFSPQGTITYASTQGGSYQLWRLQTPGAPSLQVTTTSDGVNDAVPTWSPDEQMIAFQSTRDGEYDIWTVSIASGGGREEPVRRTERDGASGRNPVWSPDGHYIAYRRSAESPDIWLIDASSWEQRPFEEHPADEFWAHWSKDGERLYFSSSRGGAFNIWVRSLEDGGEATQVTHYRPGDPTAMPSSGQYTAFAVGGDRLILPLETRSGEIYVLDVGPGV